MAIELSNLTFTNGADIVPASGVQQILNTGVANTLGGDDSITGDPINILSEVLNGTSEHLHGIYNSGTLHTDDGNDIIAGIGRKYDLFAGTGIYNTTGTIETGNGNDRITGLSASRGIQSLSGTINTGDDDDTITGAATSLDGGSEVGVGIFTSHSTLDTGKGNDVITGTALDSAYADGIDNFLSTFTTGDGNDIIIGNTKGGSVGIRNRGSIDTGNGNDRITGTNTGSRSYYFGSGIYNYEEITTGEGEDIITGTSDVDGIVNDGSINTGNGADSIVGRGGFFDENNGLYYGGGIKNRGTINTGNGNDSLIADGGFDGSGNVFLGNGKDYLKGFGSGNFDGGNGKDTLELTSGSYTVGISGTAVNFTKDSIIMNTSGFEELIAGNTKYDFNRLTNGQTIVVA
ncbi:hypothetical protein QUA41_29765 [Microcoleus sp. Pol11C1]|uniref:hypothetical protein n=1 Tax=unclassified Microcoleus TaxID=2642155 RepID=UPI002FCEB169